MTHLPFDRGEKVAATPVVVGRDSPRNFRRGDAEGMPLADAIRRAPVQFDCRIS